MLNDHNPQIVVTSLNEAKIGSVNWVAKEFFSGFPKIVGVQASSLVSETPVGDGEAITGCVNRIAQARREYPGADLYVAIEGAIDFNDFGAFVYSWAVIEQAEPERRAIGGSARVRLPDALAKAAGRDGSLAGLTTRMYGVEQDVRLVGTNGVITDGRFTRSDEFETALRCAFGYLLNEGNYLTDEVIAGAMAASDDTGNTSQRTAP